MLTSADDTLWHQLPTTFDHVGTSDPRFFDRYWFAAYDPAGGTALQITLGAYRNMDVMDAAVVVVKDGRQHNLRASRSLGAEIHPVCGPIAVAPTEPLRRFHLRVDDPDPDAAIAADLTWSAIIPAEEESPHFQRLRRRVQQDYRRFNQIGTVAGTLTVDGENIAVEEWWGCRDHSWGVRPRMGIKEPTTGPRDTLEERGFAMALLFFSTSELAGDLHLRLRSGETPFVTGTVHSLVTGERYDVADLVIDVEMFESTRRFREATLRVLFADGSRTEVIVKSSGSAIAMRGLGYSGGYHDGRGLGVWRGNHHIERDTYDVSHPADVAFQDGRIYAHWHRIQPVHVYLDGARSVASGTGSMTLVMSGRLPEFGLT